MVLSHEGGYVNDPSDSGGPTCYGITQSTARSAGYTGDMKTIPMSIVEAIYKTNYWDKLSLDTISLKSVWAAQFLFDSAVNCGPTKAAIWFQRCVSLLSGSTTSQDGIIGPGTLALFNSLDPKKLSDAEIKRELGL